MSLIHRIWLFGALIAALVSCNVSAQTHAAIKPKVGFVFLGPIGDLGWTWTHNQGRLKLAKETGVETMAVENIPESDKARIRSTIDRLVQRGCNVIVGNAFGFSDAFDDAAKAHPDIVFLNGGGNTSGPNLESFNGRTYEPMYLAGMVAGKATKSNKLGFVGANPIPLVLWDVNAFALGAQRVNPKAQVTVTFTGTWFDPVKEQAAAKALIEQGVDVLAQHQDTPGVQIAAEQAGIKSIGFNSDMSKSAPHANLTSEQFDWGVYLVRTINELKAGRWKSVGNRFMGIHDGVVDLSPISKQVDPATVKDVMTVREQIANGTFNVFEGPVVDQSGKEVIAKGAHPTDAQLWQTNYLVKGVNGSLPK
jgi:basic membrane protein A